MMEQLKTFLASYVVYFGDDTTETRYVLVDAYTENHATIIVQCHLNDLKNQYPNFDYTDIEIQPHLK